MRRCEDEKMFYRPPLLEEPCAQTLSGKRLRPQLAATGIRWYAQKSKSVKNMLEGRMISCRPVEYGRGGRKKRHKNED
jgi:hypothetical protein